MIFNVSYPDKRRTKKINTLVGKPYGLIKRIKLGGIGSPRLSVVNNSPDIEKYFRVGTDTRFCNIEFRPDGIIVWFRNAQETFLWVIPYFKLSIYQNGDALKIYGETSFMNLKQAYPKQNIKHYIKKLLEQKGNSQIGEDITSR